MDAVPALEYVAARTALLTAAVNSMANDMFDPNASDRDLLIAARNMVRAVNQPRPCQPSRGVAVMTVDDLREVLRDMPGDAVADVRYPDTLMATPSDLQTLIGGVAGVEHFAGRSLHLVTIVVEKR